jgi:hypothetical protein
MSAPTLVTGVSSLPLGEARGDGAADEVVVDHFVEIVGLRRRDVQRHVEVDVDDDALLGALLELVHADVDPDLVVAQEDAPAREQ